MTREVADERIKRHWRWGLCDHGRAIVLWDDAVVD